MAIVLLIALVAVSALPLRARTSGELTGTNFDIVSPNRHYALHNIDDYKNLQHAVFLKNTTTGTSRKIYEYGRSAGALWSPDSRYFAIDDHAGSNYTETKILSVDERIPEIDVQKEIRAKATNVPGGYHEYFYVGRWIDNRRVAVYHWGYGERTPTVFCECYVYRLNGPVRKCAHQPKDSDKACQGVGP